MLIPLLTPLSLSLFSYYLPTDSTGQCSIPLNERKALSSYRILVGDDDPTRDFTSFEVVIDDSVYKIHESVKNQVYATSDAVLGVVVESNKYAEVRTPYFYPLLAPHVTELPLGEKNSNAVVYLLRNRQVECIDITKCGITTNVQNRLDLYRNCSSQIEITNMISQEADVEEVAPLPAAAAASASASAVAVAGKASPLAASAVAGKASQFDTNNQMLVVIKHDNIPLPKAQKIATERRDLILKIPNLYGIPSAMARMWDNFNDRDWTANGALRAIDRQLEEIGVQRRLQQSIQGEAFGWKEEKFQDQRSLGMKATNELITIFEDAGVTAADRLKSTQVVQVGTWATAHPPQDDKATAVASYEYVGGGKDSELSTETDPSKHINKISAALRKGESGWFDPIPYSKHKWYVGIPSEKRFDDKYSTDQLNGGDSVVCAVVEVWRELSEDGNFRILIMDTQDFMYKNRLESQRIVKEGGFERVDNQMLKETFGDEIIVLKKNKSFILLHDHLSVAGDGRAFILSLSQQPRAMTVDCLHNTIQYAKGKINTATDENYHDHATFGGTCMRYCIKALHIPNQQCGPWYRDSLYQQYDPSMRAMDSTGGPSRSGLSPRKNLLYVSSHRARNELNNVDVIDIGLGHFGLVQIRAEDVANRWMISTTEKEFIETLDDYNTLISDKYTGSHVLEKWQEICEYVTPFITPEGNRILKSWAAKNGIKLVKESYKSETTMSVLNDIKAYDFKNEPGKSEYCWLVGKGKETNEPHNEKYLGWTVYHIATSHSAKDANGKALYDTKGNAERKLKNDNLSWKWEKVAAANFEAIVGQTRKETGNTLQLFKFVEKSSLSCKPPAKKQKVSLSP